MKIIIRHSEVRITLITDSLADDLQLVNKFIICELDCISIYDVHQAESLIREGRVIDVMLILMSECLLLIELRMEIQKNMLNVKHTCTNLGKLLM